MLLLEHIEQLSKTTATAISNIKFDKVVVWDSGTGSNGTGTSGAAGFIQSLARSLPPMLNIMRDVGGVQMPEYFGKIMGDEAAGASPAPRAPDAERKPSKE
jgi:flotillin